MTIRKSSVRNFVGAICLSLFAIVALAHPVWAQEEANSRQAQLVAQLASGNEEQKLEAVIELGALLSAKTSATSETISSLGGLLEQGTSSVVRALAARAMELSRDSRFVPVLLVTLKTEREIEVSRAIIHALAPHPTPEVVAALLPMLNHKKQDVRAATAYALAELNDPATIDALMNVLKKRGKAEDAFMRAQAARGLGKIGNREAIEVLLSALNKDESAEVRRESARSLGYLANSQDEKVIEALKLARHQPDPYLQVSAALALQKIQP